METQVCVNIAYMKHRVGTITYTAKNAQVVPS